MHASTRTSTSSPFGPDMRAAFAMPSAPVLEVRDLRFGPLAVTELRCDADDYGRSEPIPAQDALLVSFQLRSSLDHVIWEDGKQLPVTPLLRGMTSVYDLRRAVTAHSQRPFHSINFAVPLRRLDELGDDRPRQASLIASQRLGFHDPVIEALAKALLPALEHPKSASPLFVDYVLLALRAHVAYRFGDAPPRRPRGGLATWQERRAKAVLEAGLAGTLSIADVARECSLSVAQFARAFKQSTGLAPHQFLTQRRIERARELLQHTELPLADIAMRCGFADQSHFSKVFRRVIGTSPGSFRASVGTIVSPRC